MTELKIELRDWDYTCGDGCCYMYGKEVYLNGELLPEQYAEDSANALKVVLTKLGYNVEIESTEETKEITILNDAQIKSLLVNNTKLKFSEHQKILNYLAANNLQIIKTVK